MTGFIPRSPAIVAATGDILEIQHITPEQEDILFAYLDRHGEATSTKVEELLGVTQSYVMRYLHDLADRGKVQSERKHNRLVWSRVKIDLVEADVRQEYVDRIREVLAGRRDMASAIARTLNLPVKEVAATCTWMMLHGILSATTIGSTRIYAVGPRLVPQTDTARATSIPMSPEARLREQLAKLGPERPVRMTRQPVERPTRPVKPKAPKAPRVAKPKVPKAPKAARPAPQPKAPAPVKPAAPRARQARPARVAPAPQPRVIPEGWVSVHDLSEELKVERCSIRDWAHNNGHELRRISTGRGRPRAHLSAAGADAYRRHRSLRPGGRRVTDDLRRAILADLPDQNMNGRRPMTSVQQIAEQYGVSLAAVYRVISWQRDQDRAADLEEDAATPDGYQRIPDAAAQLGVRPSALYKWLEHNPEARALCITSGRRLLVSPEALARYTTATLTPGATLGTVIPDGGLTIWDAVKELGWGYSTVYRALADGQLTGMQVGGTVYFHPAPLAALRAKLDAESAVPDGWTGLMALSKELGLHPSSAVSWMRRRKIEVRQYRDAQRQVALYVPTEAADAYRTSRALIPGGIKITPQVAQSILAEIPPVAAGARYPKGLLAMVAAKHGLSMASVWNLLRAHPRQDELLTHPALQQLAPVAEDLEPPIETQPEAPIPDLKPPMEVQAEEPSVETPEAPSPAPAPRPYVTLELEQQLRAELTPERRKIPGETARIAEKYGLSVKQVRNALSRIPVQKVG